MLLAYFLCVYLFAGENETPPSTPTGQSSGMGCRAFSSQTRTTPDGSTVQVLIASPGDVEDRLQVAALQKRNVNLLQGAQVKPLDFSNKDQQLYLVYISLSDPKSGLHMTVRKTVVDSSVYEELLAKLGKENTEWTGTMFVPCQIGVKLYRDAATGLMSPTRKSISRAFANSPSSICLWLEVAATLNGSEDISRVLRCIPDNNPEYGHYPLGHTEQKACPRGEEIIPVYTSCKIEISAISRRDRKRMQQLRLDTVKALEECVRTMDEYLQSDMGRICEKLKTDKIQTIADGIKEVEEVFAAAHRLRSERTKGSR